MKYNIYTDGSCLGNGKEGSRGGHAYVVYTEDSPNIHTFAYTTCEGPTTNNQMELQAIISALEYANSLADDSTFTIFSDSAYFINAINEGWLDNWQSNGWRTSKSQPVKNKSLWEKIVPYINNLRFTFKKVKGHEYCAGNIVADKLATTAAAMNTHEVKEINNGI